VRPGYKPPSRKDLGGHLLDSVHKKLTDRVKDRVSGKQVTLMQDGWSDVHNNPVIANSIYCEGEAFFVSAIDAGANKKTASYCTSLAKEAITTVENDFQCTVTSVVTDNEKKMEVMRNNLREDNPSLTVYGCSAHWLNLLGQDITPSAIMGQVVEVNKYFRSHHTPGALLSAIPGSVKPQLPADTRWNSQMTAIETFLKNRPFMIQLLSQNEDDIDQRISNLVLNVGLYNEVKSLYKQLTPIATALNSVQSDDSSLADSCENWLDLLSNDDLQPHRVVVKKWFEKAMTTAHFLANALHPVYRGQKLSSCQLTSVHDLVMKSNPDALPDLLNFTSQCLELPSALSSQSVIESVKPTVWWACLEKSSVVGESLCSVAKAMMKMPSSSASLERIFSNFGVIQTKLRNRLGIQKAAKLVLCYRVLRGSEELDW